ncbi:hypothetical protein, conserved [Eimeria necatrix]|uniref:Uncharacterized protein n=1 Tax=Eimeria necatrix TaxID=51315 RepID=U6MQP9_9EIME|nr:hypothetical protein, conserved [Eimeria necatrix]CDJ66346.1 hypothetical protein, conserved [Eimeria necatrix]
MRVHIVQYPLAASVPLILGACMTLSVLLFCMLILLLYLRSNSELTMLHRISNCLRVLVVSQTAFTVTAVVILSVVNAAEDRSSATFSTIISGRQAANVLKAAFAALVAGYSFFATEHHIFRWVALVGAATVSGIDAVDLANLGHLIGQLQASEDALSNGDASAQSLAIWALKIQYSAKVFSFFSWLLAMQIIGCLMHALGWFELNELPNDEEVAGHLKELARATINRRIQEKRNPERFEEGTGKRLFNPTDKLEVTWDQMTDLIVGRDKRTSHPISTNPRGQIPPEVKKELRQILLKMGIKRNQIYEILDDEEDE